MLKIDNPNVRKLKKSYEREDERIITRDWKNGMACALTGRNMTNDSEDADFTCYHEQSIPIEIGNRVFEFKYIELPEGFNMYKAVMNNPETIMRRNQVGIRPEGSFPNYFYNLYVATAYAVAKTAKLADQTHYSNKHGNELYDGILSSEVNIVAYKTKKPVKLISLMNLDNLRNIVEFSDIETGELERYKSQSMYKASQLTDADTGTNYGYDVDKSRRNVEFSMDNERRLKMQRTQSHANLQGMYLDLKTLLQATTGYNVDWIAQKELIKKFSGEYDVNLMHGSNEGFCEDPDELHQSCRTNPNIQYRHIGSQGYIATYGTTTDTLNRVAIPSLDKELSILLSKLFDRYFDGFWHMDVPSLYNTNRRIHGEICIFHPNIILELDTQNPYHLGNDYGVNLYEKMGSLVSTANQRQNVKDNISERFTNKSINNSTGGDPISTGERMEDKYGFYTPSLPERVRSSKYPQYHNSIFKGIFFPNEASVHAAGEIVGGLVSNAYNADQKNAITETIIRLGLFRLIPDISEQKVIEGCNSEALFRNMSKDLKESEVCTIL